MIKAQVLAAIKQMPNVERLEVIEFALRLVREDMDKPEKLSLTAAAEVMRPFYAEGSELTEFVDTCDEDCHKLASVLQSGWKLTEFEDKGDWLYVQTQT